MVDSMEKLKTWHSDSMLLCCSTEAMNDAALTSFGGLESYMPPVN